MKKEMKGMTIKSNILDEAASGLMHSGVTMEWPDNPGTRTYQDKMLKPGNKILRTNRVIS